MKERTEMNQLLKKGNSPKCHEFFWGCNKNVKNDLMQSIFVPITKIRCIKYKYSPVCSYTQVHTGQVGSPSQGNSGETATHIQ